MSELQNTAIEVSYFWSWLNNSHLAGTAFPSRLLRI
jgi:hypothetical protein